MFGLGRRVGPRASGSHRSGGRPTWAAGPPGAPPPGGETSDQELTRLRARVAELEASERKLNTERDIHRAAAKYLAGETRW